MNTQHAPSPVATVAHLELLQGIRRLDREHNTGNRLGLWLLRAALPNVPRETLDRALMVLVGKGWIRLSAVQETRMVTPEQLAAAIPQQLSRLLYAVVMPEAPATEQPEQAETAPRPKGRRRLPAPPADAAAASPVRQLRLALDLRQADLAELLDVKKLSVVRWEQALPTPAPLLLSAALEAHRRGCLPRPEPTDGPWGWHARLFGALADVRS